MYECFPKHPTQSLFPVHFETLLALGQHIDSVDVDGHCKSIDIFLLLCSEENDFLSAPLSVIRSILPSLQLSLLAV